MTTEAAAGTETEVTTGEELNSDDSPAVEKDYHDGIDFEDSWTDPEMETETPPAADETNAEKTAEEEEEAATSTENADDESGTDNTGDDPPAEPKKSKAQERIDEITKKRREAEREADYWRGVAEGRIKPKEEEKPAEQPQENTESGSPRPREEDFDSYEEYEDALVDWRIDQREATAKAKEAETEQQAAQTEQQEKLNATLTVGADKHADFETVVRNPDLQLNEAMVEAAMEGEHAADVLYHLGKNPEESARIAGLSPIAAAREIGKIEAGLTAKAEVKPPEPKKITKAPEPIKPIGGGKTPVKKDPNAMTMDEYAAAREKGEI